MWMAVCAALSDRDAQVDEVMDSVKSMRARPGRDHEVSAMLCVEPARECRPPPEAGDSGKHMIMLCNP